MLYEALRDLVRAERPVALATVVSNGNVGAKLLVQPDAADQGTLGHAELDRIVTRDALAQLAVGQSGVRHYGPQGQGNPEPDALDTVQVFIESFASPPRMLIFGAVDFTAALTRVAKVLGYRVIVCDARTVFATKRRFPMADEVIADWPNRVLEQVGPTLGVRDAVCVLTHDPKFDVPAIVGALASDAGYIGVMGSRRTHAKRLERLMEAGVTEPADLARVMAPIGLDIGARSPEETAVSICAEIIALRTGRLAPSLRNTEGPIH
ncbi:MAG: Sulfurylase large subunit [Acidimicrobiia bacterium]|nr:Sulfurylase large subunit [Acidimicrobiia bacterium]